MVIAVDGPSGSGKSSAARGTAIALGLRYLDTGAMYRAVAWWLLEHDVDVTDADSVAESAPGLVIEISTDPADQVVRVDGTDVTDGIRSRRVSNAVSSVASVPQVRSHLIGIQREIIGHALATSGGIVAEGRDIGTVVAPDAAVKVFLTASEQVRAERRAAEMAQRAGAHSASRPASPAGAVAGSPARLADLADHVPTSDLTRIEQARRDGRDAPQTQLAADAIEIDATDLGLDDVIARIVSLAASRAGAPWMS
jgi:CMP/dCMP kinase